jgi:hypothetical protein
MSVKKLFESLFRIIRDSEDYFISGSLSFLPLMAPYREPAHDIDVSLSRTLFHAHRHIISKEGKLRVLRLPEVAVATDSSITRIIAPKTDFFHVETGDGLLDISMYQLDNDFVEFKLGAGLTFASPASLLERVQILSWEGFSYRAGPPEFAFLSKAVLYPRLKRSMAKLDEMGAKHLEDLKRLAQIIDWDFATAFLDQLEIRWLRRPIPRVFDRRFNPFREIDIDWLREELL